MRIFLGQHLKKIETFFFFAIILINLLKLLILYISILNLKFVKNTKLLSDN